MRTVVAFVVAFLLAACAPAAPPRAAPAPFEAPPAAVDRVFAAWAGADGPGCSVAVSRRGVVQARGYGLADLEHGVPIRPTTSFHVASIAKQFTALAVLLLVRDGRLSLDDDIRAHVPEVPSLAGARITLRHLLHHTSGLRDQWGLVRLAGHRPADVITDADVLAAVHRQRELNFLPGAEHLYSNTGYTLLALAAERVAGRPFPELAAERIFRPLDLAATRFLADHTLVVPRRAHGYARLPGGGYRQEEPPFDTVGPSSLQSTALDLVRYADALADGRLGADLAAAMIEPGRLADGTPLTYAAGLMRGEHRGVPTVEHGGADAAYRAQLIRFPTQHLTVACLCNTADADARRLAADVADVYLSGLAPSPRSDAAPDPARAGVYYCAQRDEVMVLEVRGGHLVANGRPMPALRDGRHELGNAVAAFEAEAGRPGFVLTVQGQRPYRFERLDPPTPTSAELAAVAGEYESPELEARYGVVFAGGALVVRPPRYPERRLTPFGPELFHDPDHRVVHVLREGGRVTGFTLSTGRVRRLRFVRR